MTENSKELLANIAPFGLRMQPELKERIKESAELNGRSMNAEIVAILEDHPRLVTGAMEISYLKMENKQLKEALEEQKTISKQLQHLLSENFEDAKWREDNDRQASEAIEKSYNELKTQSDYLENLKAELLELMKERHETDEDHLIIRLPGDLAEKIGQAAELMKRTMEDQAIDTLEKSYLPPRHLK
ncbi:hypothetical protein N183_12110 [Sinorhizobium sp. Sb3]|uniref:Arc family DNA-binding protein n=1 Tax=Sinorhizobium sp. Sb3 TaxID=1358417 RepID=UPI00071C774C|nr:Arc family DNA-binding protein [Sinorhizobium sp. Sb3]KSV84563.1 hypothetical protein N183_12110 [Sinorhizobium sp. Sb3]